MPNPAEVAVDDELALLQYLRAITAVTTLCSASAVTTFLKPGFAPPAVLVNRVGGQITGRRIDNPTEQIDCYGTDKQAAKQLALTVRAHILAIANDRVAAGVLVSAGEEVGPTWLPDVVPTSTTPLTVPRYTARYRISLHP